MLFRQVLNVIARGAFALCALIVLLSAQTPAASAAASLKGVALVIGNGGYASLSKLSNPPNDAAAIKTLLEELGFDTQLASDRDLADLKADLDGFAAKAANADVAVLYYAGHGIEAGGENFLVPVDANLSSLDAAAERLVPLSSILDRLKKTVPVAIVMLDACRNNPFPPGATIRLATGDAPVPVGIAGLGETRSAVPMQPAEDGKTENVGTVIAFAAEPGKPALDGTGDNSPYATAILRHLSAMDGAEFGIVMRMIAEEVYLKTDGKQRPWMNESLRRLLYFGRAPVHPTGAEGEILSERRELLVTIADLDDFGRDQVERVAGQAGVAMDAIYAMAEVLDKRGSKDPVENEKLLREGAERLKQLQAEPLPAGIDPELDRLTALAADAMAEGLFDAAASINEQAKARARELFGRTKSSDAEKRAQLALVFARSGETYELAFAFGKAAEDFAEAARMADKADAKLVGKLRFREVKALVSLGTYAGDNDALRRAIDSAGKADKVSPDHKAELLNLRAFALLTLSSRSGDGGELDQAVSIYRAAIEATPHKKSPAEWAMNMNGLGLALTDLAERETGTAHYAEAIKAFEDALEVTTRAKQPVEWAQTTANLGNALQGLGTREDGTENLEKAVKAYRASLEERTRERSPLDWAGMQNNLGTALSVLGARQDGTENLDEALVAHRAALEVFARERMPAIWAATMYNLAATQKAIGQKQDGTDALEEAATTYRASLEAQSKDADPLLWARTQGGLGGALLVAASRGEGTSGLENAAKAFEAGLGVLDRDRHRMLWASLQGDLGWTQSILGERRNDKVTLRQAAGSIRAALEASGRDDGADRWALMQNVLGTTLLRLTVITTDEKELTGSIAAFRAALEVRNQTRNQRDWATSRNNLANALQLLAGRMQKVDGLAEAIAAYRDALIEFTRETNARQWSLIQNNLGISLRTLAEPEKNIAMLEDGVAAFRAALEERTPGSNAVEWASSTEELARTLYLIGVWNDDTPALQEAAGLFPKALELLDPEANRDIWLDGQFRLGDALMLLAEPAQDPAGLRRSADAFGAFVETAKPDYSAYHWVVAANGRAYTLIVAYRLDGDVTRLPEAVDWARKAVVAATKANDHENAAYSADTLCDGLIELGTKQHDRAMAEEAVQACEWALTVMETAKMEDVIPITTKNLERAQALLAEL